MATLPFFHGYGTTLDNVAAVKHAYGLLTNNTLFDDLQESAATGRCVLDATLALTIGPPDGEVFGAEDSAEIQMELTKFGEAMEAKHGELQSSASTMKAGAGEKAINPLAIFQLFMTIWEMWESLRT